jgi:hypothetical protein
MKRNKEAMVIDKEVAKTSKQKMNIIEAQEKLDHPDEKIT